MAKKPLKKKKQKKRKMTEKTHHVSKKKKDIAKNIQKLILDYPIIAAVDMENLPAPQLQQMRAQLRGKIDLAMTKRRIIKHAIEGIKDKKKGIEQLEQHLKGMPALIFTKENPFSLFKELKKSKTSAPAKAGQTAPFDIIVPKGPTSFMPGPVIGELAELGIKSGVEGGKVAIKEDSVAVKEGDKISQKAAEILTRLGIEPMEVGLNVTAVYENGDIFTRDVLDIDEDKFKADLEKAVSGAFNLAMNIEYPTKDTINPLIGKAFNDAKALGLSQEIIDEGIIEALLSKAEGSALSLKSTANIETVEKPKEAPKEEKKEEKAEQPKEEPKPEPKVEEKKPEPTPVEKKEEKVLEQEKEIIKEEKKLESEVKKPEIQAPVEKLLSTGEKGLEMPTVFQKEIKKEVKEEEEKQLEKERIEKEKELQKIEEQKKVEEAAKKKQEEQKKAEEAKKEEEKRQEEEKKKAEEAKRRAEEQKKAEEKRKRKEEVKKAEEVEVKEIPSPKIEESQSDTDQKIADMVAKTKKFVKGEIPDAGKLVEEAGKMTAKETPAPEPKSQKPKASEGLETKSQSKETPQIQVKKQIPSIQELQEKKQETKEEKEKKEKEQQDVEDLTKELIKKGTLRK